MKIFIALGLLASVYSTTMRSERKENSQVTSTTSPSMKPCLDFICNSSALSTATSNCSLWNSCSCEFIEIFNYIKTLCPHVSSQDFNTYYTPFDNRLIFSGVLHKIKFEDVVEFLSDLIQPLYLAELSITSFQNMTLDEMILFSKPRCLLENEDQERKRILSNYISSFNLSTFPHRDDIRYLDISSNGLEQIHGSFAKTFKSLTKLGIGNNFITFMNHELLQDLQHLEYLSINENQLAVIERAHFSGLTNLKVLSLKGNCIANISEDVFWDLIDLESLALESNRLKSLAPDLFSRNSKLKELSLSNTNLQSLPNKIFDKLTKLITLDLSYNFLTTLPENVFQYNSMLETLNIAYNKLVLISDNLLKQNTKLKLFNANKNRLQELPSLEQVDSINAPAKFYFGGNNITHLSFTPNKLKRASLLDISGNCIDTFEYVNTSSYVINNPVVSVIVCQKCCLAAMPFSLLLAVKDSIDLSRNYINSISNNDMAMASSLNVVDLSYNQLRKISINWTYPIIQNSSMLNFNPKTLYMLKNNRINCDCHLLPFLQFINGDSSALSKEQKFSDIRFNVDTFYCSEPAFLRNRKVKTVSYTELFCKLHTGSECPEACECSLQIIPNLIHVNCSYRNLKEFPRLKIPDGQYVLNLSNNKLDSLPRDKALWSKVHSLYLSYNELTSIQNITEVQSLHKLILDHNLLTEIEAPIVKMLQTNTTDVISLAENPLKCDCNLLTLKPLLLRFDNITCFLPNGSKILINTASDASLCPESYPMQFINKGFTAIISVVVGIVILGVVISILLIMYPKEIKLWLYSHKMCLKFVTDKNIDSRKKYDAFVSYSVMDETWVASVLVPGLEQGTPSYRLCLHERDWLPGEWITEQIVASVQHSLRTIIVLSSHFIASEWSRLEFLTAYQQTLNDKTHKVIVVIPNEIPDISHLDRALQIFITENTYLTWNDKHFWRKLKCSMPRRM